MTLHAANETTGGDNIGLRASVEALDPVVALLALIHLTGDRTLLRTLGATFDGVPRGNASSFSPRGQETAKAADTTSVAEIRSRLVAAMEVDSRPLLGQPDRALFRQMAEFCAGVPLSDAACAMGREQAGFSIDEGAFEAERVPPADFKVLVLGAGMVGLIAAIKLKAAGFDFTVVERSDDVGGTWLTNTYPNVAVDTPSVQYSLSFEQNSSWTKYYPRGGEYHDYLKSVARRYRLLDQIEFGTSVEGMAWDDERRVWRVSCSRDGQQIVHEANAVITAFGFLSRPSFPIVSGLDDFGGPIIHSAQWDDSLEIDGKRVVVVGTGATAAQLSTNVGERAAHLTVIQRQPNYMLPDERTLKEVDVNERWALENIPFVAQWRRFQSLTSMLTNPLSPATIDDDYRSRTGGVSALNEGARQVSLNYIARKFADRPDLQRKLTPDFPFFAKRPILDCGYYDTLRRPNVELIEGSLVQCEPGAIRLADGTRIECDALLLATGYTLDFLKGIDIQGRGRATLESVWTPFPYAYKGLEVPGFPNFFVTSGPNSGLTASHTTLGEQQVHYIVETLKLMVDEDLAAIEVTQEACDSYNADLDRRLEQTIWVNSGTAHGYYRHASGKIVLGYPGVNLDYWQSLRRPVPTDHHLTPRGEEGALQNVKLLLG